MACFNDFTFRVGEHTSMSVLQLALLRTREQITRQGSEGMAYWGCFSIAGGKGLANRIGVDRESTRGSASLSF
jgi:hypothetical protein